MNSRIDIAQYCTEFVIEAILNYIVYWNSPFIIYSCLFHSVPCLLKYVSTILLSII